jgi:lipopolysaccharide/colanic/teichoic acid biosynthesis glycosyltransferase
MYPYSEFLQKKIFEQNNMGNTGKVQYDPRITPQGKIFRRYWIDELPQLLDWLRGEIKLVGIRAMSQHFFSLYSQEYKDLYLQVKPCIISPIFDEKTDDFKEIERIEYNYLSNYLNNPIRTDWRYFWITFGSILKGVRSK